MVHGDIEFHNTSHFTVTEGVPGLSLHRVPDRVREGLNELAQAVALSPSHVEIRFVTESAALKLTLHSGIHHEYARVYCGDYFVREHCIEPGQTLALELSRPGTLDGIGPEQFRRFPIHVWRVRLSGTNRVHFVSLDAGSHGVRPPLPAEKPSRRWLAYGSSITQGFMSSRLANPWTQLAAADLGYDLLNLGFGGSCHAEEALADHFASRDDWNLCTLELGVNLLENPITLAEFRRRTAYMLDRLHAARPDSQIILITPFLSRQDVVGKRGEKDLHTLEDFRKVLREEAAARCDRPNLRLFEGREILSRADGLTSDMCHPSDYGHALMAANFTRLFLQSQDA